jgi:hypothetical protein
MPSAGVKGEVVGKALEVQEPKGQGVDVDGDVDVIEAEIVPEGEIEIGVLLLQDIVALGVDPKVADEILRKGMVVGYKAGYRRGYSEGDGKGRLAAARLAPGSGHEQGYLEGWEAAMGHKGRRLVGSD